MAVDGDNDNDDVDGDSDSGDSDVILPVVVRNPVPFLWRQTDKKLSNDLKHYLAVCHWGIENKAYKWYNYINMKGKWLPIKVT